MSPHLPSQSLTSYRFGDITLDPARRTVRRSDANIQLGKLTYDLLLLLVEAAPRVVTQKEVVEQLWNDRNVTQDAVRQRVALTPLVYAIEYPTPAGSVLLLTVVLIYARRRRVKSS